MPITLEKVTRYQCSHCKKEYKLERFCIAHEVMCSKNPENHHACWGCKHLQKRTETYWFEYQFGMGDYSKDLDTFKCLAKDQELCTYKCSERHPAISEDGAELMPKECDLKEDGQMQDITKPAAGKTLYA